MSYRDRAKECGKKGRILFNGELKGIEEIEGGGRGK
jgi:hypothetical protein